MEGWAHPPLAQGMEEHIVRRPTLVAMKLIEQAMTIMHPLWILQTKGVRVGDL
jgi:hypothetical protein